MFTSVYYIDCYLSLSIGTHISVLINCYASLGQRLLSITYRPIIPSLVQ